MDRRGLKLLHLVQKKMFQTLTKDMEKKKIGNVVINIGTRCY